MTTQRPTHLGRRVRALRLAAGISQDELARRCDLCRLSILYLESGRHRQATAGTVARLARALGTTTDDLLTPPQRSRRSV